MAHEALQQLIDQSMQRATPFTRSIMPKTMTATEVVSFINGGKSAVIATVRKNGSPHTAWNPIAYIEEKLYTYGDPSSVFYKNAKRGGQVAIAVTSGDKAVFIEGRTVEVAKINKVIETLLSKIRSTVKDWIPDSSYNYASLEECQGSIFEINIGRILSYKGS
jgi:nitroimidazol reductase NimA-like FMN-containing flavoprotein (pyridoxamine 5'-phosphate oxidase superfamily)